MAIEWNFNLENVPRGDFFLMAYFDLVDEYDEDNRLTARNVRTEGYGIYQKTDMFGLMEVPYRGRIVQNRHFVAWASLTFPVSARG